MDIFKMSKTGFRQKVWAPKKTQSKFTLDYCRYEMIQCLFFGTRYNFGENYLDTFYVIHIYDEKKWEKKWAKTSLQKV